MPQGLFKVLIALDKFDHHRYSQALLLQQSGF